MSNQFRTEEVVFHRPFILPGHRGLQPAGTYLVETEDALIDGLSFTAWQRVSTTITRRPSRPGETIEALAVQPHDLAEALRLDRLPTEPNRG